MSREVQVRFCESREVRSLPATHPVVHCRSKKQAEQVQTAIEDRMVEVGLKLHPDKTKIVYCQDSNRRGFAEHTSFMFLGFTFRARAARNTRNGVVFSSFLPAVSKDALKKMGQKVRQWKLHRRTGFRLVELARLINPVIRGWMNYYGAFYPTELYTFLQRINTYLVRWIRKTYKRYRGYRRARQAWQRAIAYSPRLFAHWAWVTAPLPIKMMGAG
jgi:RNA-directed DNA polymerase